MPCPSDLRDAQAPVRVLALDTTAALCSVSLLTRQGSFTRQVNRREPLTPGQSRSVLEMVDAVRAPSISQGDAGPVDLIGFGSGPGAFTGLRVACGVAQGLALGWSCPVVPVDSLTTLAWQAARSDPLAGAPIIVALDVRMNEVAFAVFDPLPAADGLIEDQPWPQAAFGPLLASPEQAAAWIAQRQASAGSVRFAGDAFGVYPALSAHQPAAGAEQPEAWAVAELALIGWRAGRAIDPADAAPFYLRDKVALDRQEQERLRAARRAVAS